MNKKETSNPKGVRRQNSKDLPWWVELLFVQIGLPDKLLIKILKAKKKSKEFVANDGKSLIKLFLLIVTLTYFYPVVKHAKNKLDCEAVAKNYIIKNKNITRINKRELKMLSTNLCYGGDEIYEVENLKS